MRTKFCAVLLLLALAAVFPALLGCSMPMSQAETQDGGTLGQRIDDTAITAKIKTTYLFNGHLNPFRINIDTLHGVVVLQGVVRTDIQKDLAGEIAKNAQGVRSVRNELQVSQGAVDNSSEIDRTFTQAVVDATTTASVKTALAATKGIKASDVGVTTRWGTVTLSGTVASKAEKQLAAEVTRRTEGVKEVDDKIQVRG